MNRWRTVPRANGKRASPTPTTQNTIQVKRMEIRWNEAGEDTTYNNGKGTIYIAPIILFTKKILYGARYVS